MNCKDCKAKKFYATQDGYNGVCAFGSNWFPVTADTECVFTPKALTCKDCDCFGDYSCYTAEEDEPACMFFIDKNEAKIESAMQSLGFNRGKETTIKIVERALENFKKEFKTPFDEDPKESKEMEKLRLSEARDEIVEYLYANACLNDFIYTSSAPVLLAELNKIYEKHGFEPYKNSLKSALKKVGIDCKRVSSKKKARYIIGDAVVPSVEEYKATSEHWQYVKKVTAPPTGRDDDVSKKEEENDLSK